MHLKENRFDKMKIIDTFLLNTVSEEAKGCARLRKNYNFHQSLDDKCHCFLNAVEPESVIPVHHHPTKDETFILLRGKVRVITYYDDGKVKDDIVLSTEEGKYGVSIPKGEWHTLESLESGSVIIETKEGPYVTHEEEGILEVRR